MSLSGDIGRIGGAIGGFFQSILGAATRFFSSLFQAELQIEDNLKKIVTDFEEAKSNIEEEIQKLKDFQFNPRWKSRVINVPIAVDQVRDLIEKVTMAFSKKFDVLKAPLHDLSLIFKSEAATVADNEKPAALVRAGVKVDEIATMIDQLAKAMDTVKEMTSVFLEVTDQLQGLDALFLQQGNTQKKVVDGSPRQRQGKLHGEKT